MERVVIVGAGLYGLIAAKTYLEVKGTYDHVDAPENEAEFGTEIPSSFTDSADSTGNLNNPGFSLLVIDSASDIGGTWAEERLYPNLLSQNSYGLYEFSDLPLSDVVPPDEDGSGKQFIAGWKINRYLHAWTEKWRLKKHIRLNWRVDSVRRLESKEWQLTICVTSNENRREISVICDKLILATGLTSVPNYPQVDAPSLSDKTAPVIHAKDIGGWARDNLGYLPVPNSTSNGSGDSERRLSSSRLRSVAIYGGAKSSFDLVHFFATLHQQEPNVHIDAMSQEPIQVHWIIKEEGSGPCWMVPPTSALPHGEIVSSDKAASSRFFHYMDPACLEVPKRISLHKRTGARFWNLRVEGSWLVRLLHGNPLGRWWIRWFWNSVDRGLAELAQYDADSKMRNLRPNHSFASFDSTIGIANQADLWETIRSSHVNIHRSTIESISMAVSKDDSKVHRSVKVRLTDGVCLEDIGLAVYATGYKPIVPIRFEPYHLRLQLGMSGVLDLQHDSDTKYDKDEQALKMDEIKSEVTKHAQQWKSLDERIEIGIKKSLRDKGVALEDLGPKPGTKESPALPYRLFRRMVAPELVANGDRSFAALGIVLTSTIAVVAEVQALWVAAFLTGGLDNPRSRPPDSLCLNSLSRETMDESIAEDLVLGSVTRSSLQVDAIHYNDILLRDLGLNPYRLGGGKWRELTGVYTPSAYSGIVEEWRRPR